MFYKREKNIDLSLKVNNEISMFVVNVIFHFYQSKEITEGRIHFLLYFTLIKSYFDC